MTVMTTTAKSPRADPESTGSLRGSAAPETGRPLLPLWVALIAAVAGGLALDAAFPSLGWWPLAFVAITLSLLSLVWRR